MTSGDRDPAINAYLVVWGEQCIPAEITRHSGIIADETWELGGMRNPRTGQRHLDAGWQVNAPHDLGIDVAEYLQHLLRRISPARDYFSALTTCRIQISVVIRCREQTPVFHVPKEVLQDIAALGAALDVDLYCRI